MNLNNLRVNAKAYAAAAEKNGQPCKHGHPRCAAYRDGPCMDEVLSIAELDNNGNPLERPQMSSEEQLANAERYYATHGTI